MPIELVVDGDTSWGPEIRAAIQYLNDLEAAGVTAANIAELIRDTAAAALVAGTGIAITVNDAANTTTVAAITTTTIVTLTASTTLGLSHVGQMVRMNVGTANNLTVPPNSSVPIAVGDSTEVMQYGAGQTTIVAGVGVTLRSSNGLKLRAQYASASLIKIGTDEWQIAGDVTP